MALTKAEARSQVREFIDDPSATRWSDTSLDRQIAAVLDDLWSDMLDAQSNLTSQLQTFVLITSPGYIDLRLATQGGALSQRFYRVQHVVRDEREYRPIDDRDMLIQNNSAIVGPDFTYFVQGDQLWLFPLDADLDVELRYSFRPTLFTALTNGTNVPFPEGSENAYVYAAAASAFAKGGVEDNIQMLRLAEEARMRLISSIRRQYRGMTVPFSTDGQASFGGI